MGELNFNFINDEDPLNFCLNPDGYPEGPYCYIKGGFIETCSIPSCCESTTRITMHELIINICERCFGVQF
jgi:hypothetical protein